MGPHFSWQTDGTPRRGGERGELRIFQDHTLLIAHRLVYTHLKERSNWAGYHRKLFVVNRPRVRCGRHFAIQVARAAQATTGTATNQQRVSMGAVREGSEYRQ